jgi:hypothetical protein
MTHLWSKLSDRASVCGRARFTDRLTWSPDKITCGECKPGAWLDVRLHNTDAVPFARMNRLSGE